jgi:hypothetical protein
MSAVAERTAPGLDVIEMALVQGDLSKLTPEQRVEYYRRTCDSLGLNPLTRPFDYLNLNGKLTLYARKDCTDQLRRVHGISVTEPQIRFEDDYIIVTVTAKTADGRSDADVGAVSRKDMRGDFGNALMKAVTKSKRRVTLSICGLGMLDETEVETIPDARPVPVEAAHKPAAVADRPPVTADPQPAPAMLRTELGHLIRKMAVLKRLEADYVFAKLRDQVRAKYPDAADTTSQWAPDALRYAIDSMTKSIEKAEATAIAVATTAEPVPPNEPAHPEREPGIDDDDEDDDGPDTGEPVAAAPPPAALPESTLPMKVVDEVMETMKSCGVTWPAIITASPKVLGRQLPANARIRALTLTEGSRVLDYCRQTKAERTKREAVPV